MVWEYKKNANNTARFTLGEYNNKLDKTLICVGINPSTASPNNLDPTLKKVKAIAASNNYTNWIMLNVYPERSTNPRNLQLVCNNQLHIKNINEIRKVLTTFTNANILFAYGNLINTRPYLKACLDDILNLLSEVQFAGQKLCIKLTLKGNPIHPLYQKADSELINF